MEQLNFKLATKQCSCLWIFWTAWYYDYALICILRARIETQDHELLGWGRGGGHTHTIIHTQLFHNRELWSWSATVSSDFNVLQFEGQRIIIKTFLDCCGPE